MSDYVDVDPRFGRLADADALLEKAHALGLKVVVDLVPNHTSDEHEWFQKALAAEAGQPRAGALHVPAGQGPRPQAAAEQLELRVRRHRVGAGSTTATGTSTSSTAPSPT